MMNRKQTQERALAALTYALCGIPNGNLADDKNAQELIAMWLGIAYDAGSRSAIEEMTGVPLDIVRGYEGAL